MSVVPTNESPPAPAVVSLQEYHVQGEAGGPVASYADFSIGLLSVGNPMDCAYSWFCVPCALASARTNIDDSHWFYNVFCMGHVTERWMIRTAYDIAGSGGNDCLIGSCCIPCSANQLYQTTKSYGNPTLNGGRVYNKESFSRPADDKGIIKRFCCAVFCNPCTTGQALSTAVGMPFWMGCLCTNMCTARNIIRYQHRIIGHDLLDECLLPSLLGLATGAALFFLPLLLCVAPVVVTRSMQIQAQAESRPTTSHRYLVNNSIRQIPVPVHGIELVQQPNVIATIVPRSNRYEYTTSSGETRSGELGRSEKNDKFSSLEDKKVWEHFQKKYSEGISNRVASEPVATAAPRSIPIAVRITGDSPNSTSNIRYNECRDISVQSLNSIED